MYLASIPGEMVLYTAEEFGSEADLSLLSGAPKLLRLKKNAAIVICKTVVEKGVVNGEEGKIVDLENNR